MWQQWQLVHQRRAKKNILTDTSPDFSKFRILKDFDSDLKKIIIKEDLNQTTSTIDMLQ